MSNSNYTQGQFDLFPEANKEVVEPFVSPSSIFREVSKLSVSLSLGLTNSAAIADQPEGTDFVLSRRWEQCADVASKRDNYLGLLNVVRPIMPAQDQLIHYIK